MADQIGWHPEAYQELEAIANYIARDSEAYARGVVTRIVEAVDDLERFPFFGRRVPEWDDDSIRADGRQLQDHLPRAKWTHDGALHHPRRATASGRRPGSPMNGDAGVAAT